MSLKRAAQDSISNSEKKLKKSDAQCRAFLDQRSSGQDRMQCIEDLTNFISSKCDEAKLKFKEAIELIPRMTKLVKLSTRNIKLYYVLDGHSLGKSTEVVDMAEELFPCMLYTSSAFHEGKYSDAIKETVALLHHWISLSQSNNRNGNKDPFGGGSTISLALITENQIYFAFAGDSPIIIRHTDEKYYRSLTCPGHVLSENQAMKTIAIESKVAVGRVGKRGLKYYTLNAENAYNFTRIGNGIECIGGIGDAVNDASVVNELITWIKKWQQDKDWHIKDTTESKKEWIWNDATRTSLNINDDTCLGNFGTWLLKQDPDIIKNSMMCRHFGIFHDKKPIFTSHPQTDFFSYYLLHDNCQLLTRDAMIRVPEVFEFKKSEIMAFAIMSDGVCKDEEDAEQFYKIFDKDISFDEAYKMFSKMESGRGFSRGRDDRCGILYK